MSTKIDVTFFLWQFYLCNMNTRLNKIIIAIFVVIAIFGIGFGGYRYGMNIAKQVPNQEATALYENKQLGFSLQYPIELNDIQGSSSGVVFRIKDDEGLSGFGVTVENVAYQTTQDWIKGQPKGSALSAGFEPIAWVSSQVLLVAEYIKVDQDGSRPIYGKILRGITVENGKLYKISNPGQFRAEDVPMLDNGMIDVMNSFFVTLK